MDGRHFESFVDIHPGPTHPLDQEKFQEWIKRHKNNILLHYPPSDDQCTQERVLSNSRLNCILHIYKSKLKNCVHQGGVCFKNIKLLMKFGLVLY